MKISATEHNNALLFLKFEGRGNTIEDSIQVCKWLVEAGVDAIHVSTGSSFPHPQQPGRRDLPVDVLSQTYEQLASSGTNTFRNLLFFRGDAHRPSCSRTQWLDAGVPADQIEGLTLPDARAIKQAVTVPVICTGGFQTASVIRKRDHARRLRRGQHRAAARRQQRPRQAVRGRQRPRRASPAPTATSAWSTSSSTRSAATRRAASPSREEMLARGDVGLLSRPPFS